MLDTDPVKVLLIDSNEDEFILTRALFFQMPGRRFAVEWAKTYEEGLDKLLLNQHEVGLVDYRLGARNGVELLRTALARGCQASLILLTSADEHQVDMEAMQAGASDSLVKSQLRADLLERSIRYVLQRKRAAAHAAEMLRLEAQLHHGQKLESVGQLAAGIAHDFNNILTVIQGYSECLLARAPEDPATINALKQISLSAQRAADLTRQLLLFSRKQVMQPKLLDLSALLQNLTPMLSRLVGENVTLEHHYAHELPAIEADSNMLEQIVMNLAVNARDAMPAGGRLRLATTKVEIDPAHVRQHADARPGSFVCLTVTDTGCGMDRKTLERIFEPFFTTKEIGKGSGLGLATVYGIVKQHKGWLEVASEPGRGSTFKIYFPAAQAAVLSPATVEVLNELVQGGKETILLVEDDSNLRQFIREVLGQYHYQVLEASTGVEALRVWDEHNGRVDLLLTDMVMPDGMSGRDLAVQLRQRWPALKIIISSGYSAEMRNGDFALDGAWFLPKPYNPTQLAQLVRQRLDASPVSINSAANPSN